MTPSSLKTTGLIRPINFLAEPMLIRLPGEVPALFE